jgi:hypothetical protein
MVYALALIKAFFLQLRIHAGSMGPNSNTPGKHARDSFCLEPVFLLPKIFLGNLF